MGRNSRITIKELLPAIKGSRAFISVVAERLGCDWHTADKAIRRFPAAIRALEDEKETALDFVEGKAFSRIAEGDGAMIRFYLATKGKARGFTYDEKADKFTDETDTELTINIVDGVKNDD